LDRRLRGPQSRSGCGGEEKNSQPLPALEPPIIQSIVQRYTTELSRHLVYLMTLLKSTVHIASNGKMIVADKLEIMWEGAVVGYFNVLT
jgi:hypothetical protein